MVDRPGCHGNGQKFTRVNVMLLSVVMQVNGVDIIITREEPLEHQRETAYLAKSTPLTETLPTPTEANNYRCNISETDSRMYGSSSAMSYASSFDPDNVALRRPIYSG